MQLPKPNEDWDRYEGMRFAAGYELGLNAYGIHMRRRTFDGGWEYVKSVEVITEVVDPTVNVMPPILLSDDEAEGLMTALWNAGVRPRSGEGHTSHIQALNKHLRICVKSPSTSYRSNNGRDMTRILEKRSLLIVGDCVVRSRAVLVAPVARDTSSGAVYGAVAYLNTRGESVQVFGEIQETKRRSGRVLYCVKDNAEVYRAVFPDVELTCCQCSSPARAQLDGRYYCFTHVPLMTNWQPVKSKKKKVKA